MKKTLCFLIILFSCSPLFASDWFRQTTLSPDGSQIAFGHKGNIYTVSSKGGVATLLAGQSYYEGHPIWSHDGQTIAYVSDRFGNMDVYTKPSVGGASQRLTFHSNDDWPSDFSRDNKKVIFESLRDDLVTSSQFPYSRFTELYSVSTNGGMPSQINTLPLEKAKYSSDGLSLIYQDKKSPENPLRKHHTSSAARDIWQWNLKKDSYTKLTDFAGEDRQPQWMSNGKGFFYLSEESGTFNVWKKEFGSKKGGQVTHFKTHPVRDLTIDDSDNLAFTYHGDIFYLKADTKEAQKLPIIVRQGDMSDEVVRKVYSSKASEFAVSPNGKEIALIIRGEVFVTSVEFNTTKRITNTPEQERSVSFSPDGRKLVYASERGRSWNLYQTSLEDKDEEYFFAATKLKEVELLKKEEEAFSPRYSPNGLEVAFIGNRDAIKVINLKSKAVRTVLPEKYNTTYTDFDLMFRWSPDSQWIAAQALMTKRFIADIVLIKVIGGSEIINITNSGYEDFSPSWEMGGKLLTWKSLKYGQRNHGSWGAQANVFGLFLTQKALDDFDKSKEKRTIEEEIKKESKKEDKKKDKTVAKKKTAEKVVFEVENFEKRIRRLSRNSANISSVRLTEKADKMYFLEHYASRFELWEHDFVENKLKKLQELTGESASFELLDGDKTIMLFGESSVKKLELKGGKVTAKPVTYSAEYYHDDNKERANMFEHVWRQTLSKFYVKDMHGADWDSLKVDYEKKLPSISNNRDFAVLLSELLGELNASHTGAYYRAGDVKGRSQTASLGAYFDRKYKKAGLKIAKIVSGGPLAKAGLKIKEGMIIVAIDGTPVDHSTNVYKLLNHKAGQRVRLKFKGAYWGWKKGVEQVVEPITLGAFEELKYQEWIKRRRDMVDKLSKGKLGYVHVRGMNTRSFQETYSEALGRHHDKEGLLVDTRYNGGGWLHDDLNTFLSGQVYFQFMPRGRHPNPKPVGVEPIGRWTKPSLVLVNETNYSDGYLFPYSYKNLGIGKLVGMPVAATGTAVWWERLQSNDIVFGIPQLGVLDNKGQLQENRDLKPDYQVENTPKSLLGGKDLQIEKAVQVMLGDLKSK